MKQNLILIAIIALLAAPVFAEPAPTNGDITDVIVYRGRALVTRTIDLNSSTGDIELLVEDLPSRILPESLYAQAGDGIQVLSVRYREKTIAQDNRKEVLKLEEEIIAAEDQMQITKRDHEHCFAQNARFSKMWELSFEGANLSIDRAAFSSETMKDFTTYLEDKNESWHKKAVELEAKLKNQERQIAKLKTKLEKLKQGHQTTVRQALVYLNKKSSKKSALKLSYLVSGADWSPKYNLKTASDKSVNIEYHAVVHQSSGENWNNATLALSTAAPAMVATPPILDPMKISLTSAQNRNRTSSLKRNVAAEQQAEMPQASIVSYNDQTKQFSDNFAERNSNIGQGIKAQVRLNQIAISNQMIEFEVDKRMLKELKKQTVAIRRTEGVSVLYKLPGKLTLPSRSDQQLVTIAMFKAPAKFTFVAAPLLTDYVYLQGQITNNSSTILLPGPADMFRNGQFVGKADMKLATIGQTFDAGFGVDSQIQVTREFKDKTTKSFLGNRMDEQIYRIEINNYYHKPIALKLMDRLPWTENEELSIELNTVSQPLSTDTEYIRTEKEKGILRWDLNLKPDTTAEKATVINYTFTLKYDNDMAIRNIN